MSITDQQKRAIDSIISIFETGRVPTPAAYATCAVLKDGAGISYGKHQCTDKSGSLDLVCKRYIDLRGRTWRRTSLRRWTRRRRTRCGWQS